MRAPRSTRRLTQHVVAPLRKATAALTEAVIETRAHLAAKDAALRAQGKGGLAQDVMMKTTALALATSGAMVVIPGGAELPGSSQSSVSVTPSPTRYRIGAETVVDDAGLKLDELTPRQQGAHALLHGALAQYQLLQRAGSDFSRVPGLEQAVTPGQAAAKQEIETLLAVAFPKPVQHPIVVDGDAIKLVPLAPPSLEHHVSERALDAVADWADGKGLGLADTDLTFRQGQAKPPANDVQLVGAFFGELAGHQYAELVPFDEHGAVQLAPRELSTLQLLRALGGDQRQALRGLSGYATAPEGTPARAQETQLGNEVVTPELLGAVAAKLEHYGIDPAQFASGISPEQAQGVFGQVQYASFRDGLRAAARAEQGWDTAGNQFGVTVQPIDVGHTFWLRTDVAERWLDMQKAAADEGITLGVNSAFRTWDEQAQMYYVDPGPQYAYPPGHSNHQGGVAVDVSNCWEGSPVYDFLQRRGAEFGFYLPFPGHEPWHWQLVGTPA